MQSHPSPQAVLFILLLVVFQPLVIIKREGVRGAFYFFPALHTLFSLSLPLPRSEIPKKNFLEGEQRKRGLRRENEKGTRDDLQEERRDPS